MSGYPDAVALLRDMRRKDGTTYVQVLYRLDGQQTSSSFQTVSDRRGSDGRWGETTALRTINVPETVLDKLDYSREWLFTNAGAA